MGVLAHPYYQASDKAMILEEETFEAFGYYQSDLKRKSRKLIIAACELCGEFRILPKYAYHTFCHSCTMKGKPRTEETKAKISAAMKGEKNHFYGKLHTEEAKLKMSAAKKGEKNYNHGKSHTKETIAKMCAVKKGEKHPGWKGGMKIANARHDAKRKRDLGYNLLTPLREGEVGHHITNECVIGIPTRVHDEHRGTRQKHRTLILQWLKTNDKKKYKLVLCILAKQPLK